jgi:hypothetical protein
LLFFCCGNRSIVSVSRLQELEDIALGSQEHRPQAAKSYFLNKFRRSASPGPKAIATIVHSIFPLLSTYSRDTSFTRSTSRSWES